MNSRDFCVVVEVYRFDTGVRGGAVECLEICEILYSFGGCEVETEVYGGAVDFLDEFRLLARDLSVLVSVEIFKAVSPESLVFYARADICFIGQWGGLIPSSVVSAGLSIPQPITAAAAKAMIGSFFIIMNDNFVVG